MEEKTELLVAADRLEELGFETAASALRKLASQTKYFYLVTQDDCTHDEVRAVVVRASSPKKARLLVSKVSMDEGRDLWLDPKRSRCTRLSIDGTDEVICRDALGA